MVVLRTALSKIILPTVAGFFGALACVSLMGAQAYGIFQPGGALSGTWNSQQVSLSSGPTNITGNLPVGNLNSGTGASGTTFWAGNGQWLTPAGTLTLANPTGTIGLTAVNGVATTAMRSDAAPALSQSISPTWTGTHTFTLQTPFTANGAGNTSNVYMNSASPGLGWNESDSAANNRLWDMIPVSGQLMGRALLDNNSAATSWVTVSRANEVITRVAFPTSAAESFLVGTATSLNTNRVAQFAGGNLPAGLFQTTSSAQVAVDLWNTATSGNNGFVEFQTEGSSTARGSITYNRAGGLTTYNTTSDVRLKTNIADASDAGAMIDGIKVRQFDWRETGNHVDHWLVAQELFQVAPMAVTEGGYGKDEAQWSVDPSKLVPALVQEVQSLRKRVAQLEATP